MKAPKARIRNASTFESLQLADGFGAKGGTNGDEGEAAYTRSLFAVEDKPGIWIRVKRTRQALMPAEGNVLATGAEGGVIELRRFDLANEELTEAGFMMPADEDGMVQGSLLPTEEEEAPVN